jgi:serine/threonine-protein kinase
VIAAGVAFVAVAFALAQRIPKTKASADATPDALKARDAGPGGDRGLNARLAQGTAAATPAKSPAVKPETIVVYRNNSDSEPGIQVPVVISRAESLAIADAVRKRIVASDAAAKSATDKAAANVTAEKSVGAKSAAGQATDLAPHPAGASTGMVVSKLAPGATETRIVVSADGQSITLDRAQLLAEVSKIFADSIAMAYSRMDTAFKRAARVYRFETTAPSGRGVTPMMAPPSDGRIRIVVSNYSNATGKREMSGVGRDVAHFLRAALPTDKYDVVDNDVTDRASRGMGDPLSLGWSLRADFIVNGVVMQRADSVVLLTQFRDVRDGRFSRAGESTAPIADPRKAFDGSLLRVSAWLDSAKTMRSRRPPGPPRAPGGPGGAEGAMRQPPAL